MSRGIILPVLIGVLVLGLIGYSQDVLASPVTLDTAGSVGSHNSIAIGTDNYPVISYLVGMGFNGDLKVVHCTSADCSTFDTPVALDTVGIVGGFTSIAIGTDNFPVISYRDTTNGDLKVVHCGNTSCTSGNTITTVDSAGDVGQYTSIAIGADNYPVISYFAKITDDLKVVHCTSANCSTFDTPVALDTVGSVGRYTSIAIGADNYPVISYHDFTNGNLKAVHCTSANCSTFDTPVPLDTVGDVGQFTSIAIGADNNPVISYYDQTNGDLKAVHCTSADCSTFDTPVALDTVGIVGWYISIAIGTDNFPVISYHDVSNGNLKAVHCTSANCSTFDTPVPLDTVGDVGEYTSIAIGADNFPVISYFDNTNDDLKVVQFASSGFCGVETTLQGNTCEADVTQSDLDIVNADLLQAETELINCQNSNSLQTITLTQCQDDNSNLTQQVSDQQTTIDDLNQEIIDKNGIIADLNSQISSLDSQIGILQTDNTLLQQMKTMLEGQVATLQADLATAESDLATAESDLTTAESDLATAESDLATADNRIVELEELFTTPALDKANNAQDKSDKAQQKADLAQQKADESGKEKDQKKADKEQDKADKEQVKSCGTIQKEITKLVDIGIAVPAELQQLLTDNCS